MMAPRGRGCGGRAKMPRAWGGAGGGERLCELRFATLFVEGRGEGVQELRCAKDFMRRRQTERSES